MNESTVNPLCQYCNQRSKLVDGSYIYPHRPDLSDLNFYICDGCDAYVGCHKGTIEPLGCLANAELRKWKSIAHKAFDPLWRDGGMKRSQAYRELAEALNIEPEDCHIGMFSVEMCKGVYGMIKDGLFPINK